MALQLKSPLAVVRSGQELAASASPERRFVKRAGRYAGVWFGTAAFAVGGSTNVYETTTLNLEGRAGEGPATRTNLYCPWQRRLSAAILRAADHSRVGDHAQADARLTKKAALDWQPPASMIREVLCELLRHTLDGVRTVFRVLVADLPGLLERFRTAPCLDLFQTIEGDHHN